MYFFNSRYDPERSVLGRLCNEKNVLEVLELYSLDRHQQWNSDRPEAITQFYGHIDKFMRLLAERCSARGWSLMLVSDHGHEPIRASHDLRKRLAALPIGGDEYSYFLEVSNVRFWFHTDAARKAVRELLAAIPAATVIRYNEMAQYGIPLSDSRYGELFAYLDPGHIFFQHDFHHPLANLWLGLTDPMQRARPRDDSRCRAHDSPRSWGRASGNNDRPPALQIDHVQPSGAGLIALRVALIGFGHISTKLVADSRPSRSIWSGEVGTIVHGRRACDDSANPNTRAER
jgi:hypothetical protein